MKKLLFVLLALTLCVTFLTACKKDEGDTEDNPIVDSGDNNQNDDNQNDDNQNGDNKEDIVYSEGLAFTSNGDGTCYVSGIGTCTDTDVVIPATSPDGDVVTGIVDEAFMDAGVESVCIPDSLTNIGRGSFGLTFTRIKGYDNSQVYKSVDGNLYSTDGKTLVMYCPGKPDTSFTVPEDVTAIANFAFAGSFNLLEIRIHDRVTTIGRGAFYGCRYLASINLPSSLTVLEEGVLSWCPSLTAITLPEGLQKIGNYAFDLCGIYSIEIPDSVTEIGEGAFQWCPNLKEVKLSSKLTCIQDFTFAHTDLVSVVIPKSVKTIKTCAFVYSNTIFNLYYTGGAEEWSMVDIDSQGNDMLNKVIIYYYSETKPTTDGNFWHYVEGVPTVWENIAEETYSEGLVFTSNGDGTCYVSGIGTCTDTDIVIPTTSPDGDKVIGIGDSAFSGCENLTGIVIPDSVTSIGWSAFCNCSSLTDVTIPDSVTSIGDSAFYSCTGLASITIPDIEVSIGAYAFYGTAYYNDESNWENGVLYIGKHLVVAKTDMSNIYVVKDGTLDIASEAFSDCRSLTGVEIPDSVTSIGERAFSNCYSLTSIVIPDGVTSIGERAFSNCRSLTSIVISDGLKHIGEIAFYGCESLTSIIVDENNQNYKSVDDNLYSKDGKTLVAYAPGKTDTDFVIPDGVTCIGNYAFSNCRSLASIVIPDGVTSIGNYAFSGCFRFTSIVIPDSVTSIGNYAFSDCSGLTSMVIPDGVTSIGDSAFSGCDRLTSIVIPDSVTSIGKGVFNACNSFTDVYYKGSEAEWAEISIGNSNSYLTGATIHYNYTE